MPLLRAKHVKSKMSVCHKLAFHKPMVNSINPSVTFFLGGNGAATQTTYRARFCRHPVPQGRIRDDIAFARLVICPIGQVDVHSPGRRCVDDAPVGVPLGFEYGLRIGRNPDRVGPKAALEYGE